MAQVRWTPQASDDLEALMSIPNVGRDADFARRQDRGRDDQM